MRLESVSNSLNEVVLAGTHSSGLKVTVIPKEGFSKTFGVLSTHFGSIDNRFADPLTGRDLSVPDGVAHFLEHKMFEDEKGDVSDRFAALGAQTNAWTSFTTTSYLFSSSSEIEQCLKLLVDFVQEPYFTEELLSKERGIIAQEIGMYDDDPSWRAYFDLLQCLYRDHPVRINIAGTVESIAEIDCDVLNSCHRAFYRPGNMALTVVGKIDPDLVVRVVNGDLGQRDTVPGGQHRRKAFEDGKITSERHERTMPVSRPKVLVGFKDFDRCSDDQDLVRQELTSGIALELLFGCSSTNYKKMYDSGLIDDSFSAEYSGETDFGFAVVGGDTDSPDDLVESVIQTCGDAPNGGFLKTDFDRIRNKMEGRFIGRFDSVESTAYSFSAAAFRGVDPFRSLEILSELSLADVAKRSEELFQSGAAAAIVLPSKDTEKP